MCILFRTRLPPGLFVRLVFPFFSCISITTSRFAFLFCFVGVSGRLSFSVLFHFLLLLSLK
ncbi:hypothetical protein BZA05DRAFT_406352 [Tricharina praecox]|uniref:uncharacterized protein n=1 Tax=Tricharina praecox TaxID=43433 RepID=UPI00221FA831|nr:uncharacterized protein BZA05DRAFT_406352 [Tricharina praecox]KAI5846703.1 hypothetical protein BZA05DRAFT_406352 [Tricharina praecox]